jgi:hypothetical protein
MNVLLRGTRHLILTGLLFLAGGGGLALLVSSASGQASGEPLFHDSGPIVFNFVTVGEVSEPESVTISNDGEGNLEITSVVVSASVSKDFSIAADQCTGTSLSAGQSCMVSVIFSPIKVGTLLGSLVISDTRATCKNYVSLAGSGTATSPSTTAKAADCEVPGATITVPGPIVTVPGQTVTVHAPTPPLETDALQLVSPPQCVSGRHISMYIRTSRADQIKMARVYINGHLAKTASSPGSPSILVVDLRGKPLHRYRVQVIANIATGPALGFTRYFTACRSKKRHSS